METKVLTVARKEFTIYFSSPMGFIFLGTFLAASMFGFFWVSQFFSRNIVDVRPLFESMPVLLIFLMAALTMRMWSEERRMGTIEFLLTMPLETHVLVFGKFLACLGLVAVALALTIGVPITVSFMGELDWGPVLGAYLAALLLAGAYAAVGLYISAKSENQIVSLILTIVACFVFYVVGSETFAGLFGNTLNEFLHLLGTGARFESISRGMIDLRDLYYYLSIVAIFLTLNTLALEKIKWSAGASNSTHKFWKTVSVLLVCNFLAANIWLQKTHLIRADLTDGNIYSISAATKQQLAQLQEPLLIRGYFSAKTHPLLAPLVPEVRDMIREYEVASNGKVRSEFIDPASDQELEEEAGQKYNIKPVPFQVSDRYSAALVNSYFHLLVRYGDQFEVLGFEDLIEVKPSQTGSGIDVKLRNLEYDITKSIKKVLFTFQNLDNLFAGLQHPVKFIGYFSADAKLPKPLQEFVPEVNKTLSEIAKAAGSKFEFALQEPEADGGALAKEILERFGFRPIPLGFLSPEKFYFYMILQDNDKIIQVALPETLKGENFKKSIESSLKRFSPGFLKTVGLATPPASQQNPWMQQMGMGGDDKQFRQLVEKLSEGYTVKNLDLKNGIVPEDVDSLVLAAPENLGKKELFAVDQFLMKGGSVIISSGAFSVKRERTGGANGVAHTSGLEAWLENYGISLEKKMVLDPQNETYPVQIPRKIGQFTVEELRFIPYPLFVDVRGKEGLNSDIGITSGVPHVTINWGSPLKIDADKNKDRKVIEILKSSENSWASTASTVQPNFELFGELGFMKDSKSEPYMLAALVEGSFTSFFKDKESPIFEEGKAKEEEKIKAKEKEAEEKAKEKSKEKGKKKDKKEEEAKKDEETKEEPAGVITSIIDRSPATSRIILFASNEFLADQTLMISRAGGTERFMNSLQLAQNAVDWSVEDTGLLSLRGRGHFSRTLDQMTNERRMFYEYLNYALILVGLAIVYGISRFFAAQRSEYFSQIMGQASSV